jgi:hypothetical protein
VIRVLNVVMIERLDVRNTQAEAFIVACLNGQILANLLLANEMAPLVCLSTMRDLERIARLKCSVVVANLMQRLGLLIY